MANRTVKKTFYGNDTLAVPAGVRSITVKVPNQEPLYYAGDFCRGIIAASGPLYAWGANNRGQLGDGTVTGKSTPVMVLGGLNFQKVYGQMLGGSTIALDLLGTVYGWGFNDQGQLGLSDIIPRSSPVAIVGPADGILRFTDLHSGFASVIGLKGDGTLYAWGLNSSGQLGLGDVVSRSSPVIVLGGLKFKRVHGNLNANYFMLLSTTGAGYGMGINTSGQLGTGDVTPRSSPVAVLGGLTFRKIMGGEGAADGMSMGMTTAGVLYAWGNNAKGELGVGDVTPRSSPVAVVGGHSFVTMYNGRGSNYAIKADGSLYSWGNNVNGELGVGDVTARSSPVAVLGGLKFKWVGAGINQVFALTQDGTAYAWGLNTTGTLGVGDVVPRSSPVAVLGGFKWSRIFNTDYGASTITGISTEGIIYSWGTGASGENANAANTAQSSPVAIVGGLGPKILLPESFITQIEVTPGTSYPIIFGVEYVSVGQSIVGRRPQYLTVEYDQ